MKMLAKFKKSSVEAKSNLKDSYNNWSSEMKDKVVRFIIDSGKDGDVKAK